MSKLGIVTWTVVIGLIIIGIYIILKKILVPSMLQGPFKYLMEGRIILIEKTFWPIFIISVGISIIIAQPTVGLGICVFSTVVLWKPINNYLLGLIYLAGKTYFVGQRIRYKDQLVTLRAFNNISIEMELDDGELMDVPYHDFADSIVVRSSPKSGVLTHSIALSIAKPCVLEIEENKIRALLLSLPWVLPKQKILFERISEDADQYSIKVIVHGIDQNHLHKVEYKIKSMYQPTESN